MNTREPQKLKHSWNNNAWIKCSILSILYASVAVLEISSWNNWPKIWKASKHSKRTSRVICSLQQPPKLNYKAPKALKRGLIILSAAFGFGTKEKERSNTAFVLPTKMSSIKSVYIMQTCMRKMSSAIFGLLGLFPLNITPFSLPKKLSKSFPNSVL